MDWSKKEEYQKHTYTLIEIYTQQKPQLDLIHASNLCDSKFWQSSYRQTRTVNDDACPETKRNIRKCKGDYRIALYGSKSKWQRSGESLLRVAALHSLRPVDASADLFAISPKVIVQTWLWINPESVRSRWKCAHNSKSTNKLLRQMLPHHRSHINNAFSSCGSHLQKIRFVFTHLIQYAGGDLGTTSDWPITDSLCIHAHSKCQYTSEKS